MINSSFRRATRTANEGAPLSYCNYMFYQNISIYTWYIRISVLIIIVLLKIEFCVFTYFIVYSWWYHRSSQTTAYVAAVIMLCFVILSNSVRLTLNIVYWTVLQVCATADKLILYTWNRCIISVGIVRLISTFPSIMSNTTHLWSWYSRAHRLYETCSCSWLFSFWTDYSYHIILDSTRFEKQINKRHTRAPRAGAHFSQTGQT